MNNEWEEYCKYVARVTSKSMEQVNEAFMRLHDTAKESAKKLDRFQEVVDSEKIIGNKRNGTQDRRQAFGGLF
jgi:hypothetical protein